MSLSTSSGEIPPSCLLYAYWALALALALALADFFFFLVLLFFYFFCFTLLLSAWFFSRLSCCIWKYFTWGSTSHLLPKSGPPLLPRLCCIPAPIQRCSHDPLHGLLIIFPPSNFDRTCIQDSARFAVTLSISCSAVATSLFSMTCMSQFIIGLISVGTWPPHRISCSMDPL